MTVLAAACCKAASTLSLTEAKHSCQSQTLCRSVLAEAIFAELLATAPQLNVSAESASVGPAFAGGHDERVVDAAAAAGIALLPRRPRAFDEAIDIVAFDLVLVMDHFDCEDVPAPAGQLGASHAHRHKVASSWESTVSAAYLEVATLLHIIGTIPCSCSLQ